METQTPPTDDTKTRLIQAAGEEFAGHGFKGTTVRDICRRAGAHVGAVNYHFGDKEGLYEAVLDYSHRMATQKYPPDMGLDDRAGPEERLAAFVRSLLLRILGEGLPAWHGKLMAQEIANPTGMMKQMIKNSIRSLHTHLSGIVSALFQKEGVTVETGSPALFLCTMSIVGQCLHHFKAKEVVAALRPKSFDPANIETLADHIALFSIGGIRALAHQEKSKKELPWNP
ncbi:MAG: CerR family C-terminal domain-containing protein [Thermodesulfobacteriota bacterium]|nr:CerR family C-terminal domain-containing protein [Thermodesulfobacteriota bacterium]